MDCPEFLKYLMHIKVMPQRITREEGTQIFKKANRTTGVSDDDANELTMQEFKRAVKVLASMIGIGWEPGTLASLAAHVRVVLRIPTRCQPPED
eukprot:2086084-Rhodomonas_salina.7